MESARPFESPQDALRRAVSEVGSQSALARLLGVTQQSVSAWLRKGMALPGEHVLAVEAKTNISRYELNPEVFGAAPEPAADAPALLDAQR